MPSIPPTYTTSSLTSPTPATDISRSWLWPQVLPTDHVTLLAGPPGIGKSLIALDFAARVSTGAAFPFERTESESAAAPPPESPPQPVAAAGTQPDQSASARPRIRPPASVLLFAPEDHPHTTIAPRLRALGADLSRFHLVGDFQPAAEDPSAETPRPTPALAVRALIETALRLDIRGLIILDPLAAFLGHATAADLRLAFDALNRFARDRATPILAIAHTVPGRAANSQRIVGPSILSSFPRTILQAEHIPTGRTLFPAKSNLAIPPSFTFSIEPDRGLIWHNYRHDLAGQGWSSTLELAERPRFDEACRFLRTELSRGPREATEVTALAASAGIRSHTLRAAREFLRVRPKRMGFGGRASYNWSIPTMDAKIARAQNGNHEAPAQESPPPRPPFMVMTLSDLDRFPRPQPTKR